MNGNSEFARRCQRLNMAITHVTETLGAVLLATIVVINSIAVFYRYALTSPIGWSEETLRYAIVWAVYLVAGATIVRGEQMAVNLLAAVKRPAIRRAANLFSILVTVVLTGVILVYGIPLVIGNISQFSPTMQIPMAFPYASVTVGYLIVAVQSVLLLLSGDDAVVKGA
jgi:TRAP-type C4-dicarboxylate transport system permease small subunit